MRELKAEHKVAVICRCLGVKRKSYYAWVKRERCSRRVEDDRLRALIERIHEESDGTYGSRRMMHELRRRGEHVGRRRVRRLMSQMALKGVTRKLKRRVYQLECEGLHAVDLVRRNWHPAGPNELWVADITQINTWQGPLYLALVMDVWSRKVVGWSMQPHMKQSLVIEALEMAVARRKPGAGLIHHSDHGSQYTSWAMGATLRDAGILPSMGRVRTCYDNAVAESVFKTLKYERTNRRTYPTLAAAMSDVFEYLEGWYNTRRLHSKLGYMPPAEYEQLHGMDAA